MYGVSERKKVIYIFRVFFTFERDRFSQLKYSGAVFTSLFCFAFVHRCTLSANQKQTRNYFTSHLFLMTYLFLLISRFATLLRKC